MSDQTTKLAAIALHNKHLKNSTSMEEKVRDAYGLLDVDSLRIVGAKKILAHFKFKPDYVEGFNDAKFQETEQLLAANPAVFAGNGDYQSTHCEDIMGQVVELHNA